MGVLGGQARVEGVQGTWADLTTNVNKMAANLTDQVRSIATVTKAVAQVNFFYWRMCSFLLMRVCRAISRVVLKSMCRVRCWI